MSIYRWCSRLCGRNVRRRSERDSKLHDDDAVTHNAVEDNPDEIYDDVSETFFASPPELSPSDTLVAPVSLVDSEGFEWAIIDGEPPARPPSIPKDRLFIPLPVRPKRGFLYNQILTNSEVPDMSPFDLSNAPSNAMVPMSLLQEQVLRALRAAAIDMHYHNGAHVRSFSRRRLLRNGNARNRSGTDSSTVVSMSSRPPSSASARSRHKLATSATADTRGLIAIQSILRR